MMKEQPAEPLVKAVGITRVFGKGSASISALRGADLTIPARRLIALRGRSGSGKTTLINILGMLDRPTEGTVMFAGEDLARYPEKKRSELRRRQMGLIFQSFGLVPLMTAYENVEFGLRIAGVKPALYKEYGEYALELVGLRARMKHRPYEMSGGEQQRVAIARAIAHKPSLILADEPTAELDSKMGMQVMQAFRSLVRDEGMTVILTTHDPAIMSAADQIYTLEDGRIAHEEE
ncbi:MULTISPECIES: ABC transporter ATP-binding protein [Paenibacillus]|uniref:ABC transporter ATP-binding protein n=1 Tax=Paenibacillus TaxID=44249 RepID=UPI0022B8CC32|nr:ABC transporter ATP-binding protein [Paenibacillus caseinilyticus]MCZ8519509.1 ABC transporter ATP-binding protein [Paenibacillus caseinilyticus]